MHTASQIDVHFSTEAPLLSVLKRFFEDVGWQSSDAFLKEAIPRKPHSLLTTVWVSLSQNTKPIGMARIYLPPKSADSAPAFIGDVIIDSLYQRQGFGNLLINAMEAHCKEQGVQLLVIEPTDNSENFWKRMGFKPQESIQGLLFKSI